MNCTMIGPYCQECESRSGGRKNVDSESAPFGAESGAAKEGSGFAKERCKLETGQHRCERACRVELHLTPCDLEQFLELEHRAEDQHSFVDGTLVSRTSLVEHDEHTQIADSLGSLLGPL